MEPATAARIISLRQASLTRPLSLEELKEAIRLMREDRVAAQAASTKSRAAKGPKVPINADDLLKGLTDF